MNKDFMKFHMTFAFMYILTYIGGLLKGSFTFLQPIHPLFGMLTLILPLLVYLLSKNKKLINQMIINNFNLRGNNLMKVAKISTVCIMVFFILQVMSGVSLNVGIAKSDFAISFFRGIHKSGKYLVPLFVGTHIFARLNLKKMIND